MKEASLIQIKKYFRMTTVEFMEEWKKFSEEEKKELQQVF